MILRGIAVFILTLTLSVAPSFSEVKAPTQSRSADLNEKGVAAMQAKNFAAAEDIFKKAVDADPFNLTAAFNLAGAYLSQKKDAEAIALLKSYADKDIKDAGLYVRLGDAYFVDKKIKEAIESYKKAQTLAPKYLGLAAKMGTLYALSNNLVEAEKSFKQAVALDEKDGGSLSNLASILLANKKPDEAIQTAKRALQVAPSPEVYITMGSAYEEQKDFKNALISFERARDLGVKSPQLDAKLEELSKQK